MPSHRLERVAEAIRETVASAILFEMADPRVKGVTVVRTEVAGDLRNATVYVSVMGSESRQKQVLGALKHASGFLQSKVAARLQTRFTPVLAFKTDRSVKTSIALSRLIDETIAADQKAHSATAAEDTEDEVEDLEPEDGADEVDDGDDADEIGDEEAPSRPS